MWRFHRAQRDPGAVGDLGVGEVLEERELDDPALRLTEAVQFVEQEHPVGDRGVDAGCRCPAGADWASAMAASASLRWRSRRAQPSAILCRATPDQPGRERALVGAEAGPAGPRGDEDLLGDVLGVGAGPNARTAIPWIWPAQRS